jgi:hypothetical protein
MAFGNRFLMSSIRLLCEGWVLKNSGGETPSGFFRHPLSEIHGISRIKTGLGHKN